MAEQQRPDRTPRKNSRPNGNGSGPNGGGIKFGRGLFGWVLFIGLAVMLFIILQSKSRGSVPVDISEVQTQLKAGNVAEVTLDGETLRGTFRRDIAVPGASAKVHNFRTDVPPTQNLWEVCNWLLTQAEKTQTAVKVENSSGLLTTLIVPLIPWILVFGFIWFFVFRQ